jgi:hypothetical protein
VAVNTAGTPVTRQQLDQYLTMSSVAMKHAISLAAQLAKVVGGLSTEDLTNLDPDRPYTADEVYAIQLFAEQLGATVKGLEGEAVAAVTTSLMDLGDTFIGLTVT